MLFTAVLRRGFNCLYAQLINRIYIALDQDSSLTLFLFIIISSSRSQKAQPKRKGAMVAAADAKKE